MNNNLSIVSIQEFQSFENKEEYIYVNFSNAYSIKVIPFYESICENEINKLIKFFYQITDVDIRVEDLTVKIHLVLLKILIDGEKNTIVLNDVGISKDSREFLIDSFNKILNNFANKNIIIIENIFSEPNFKYFKK